MFERMDRNRDGKLDQEDFRSEHRGPGMGPEGTRRVPVTGAEPVRTVPGAARDQRGPRPKRPAGPAEDSPNPEAGAGATQNTSSSQSPPKNSSPSPAVVVEFERPPEEGGEGDACG